MHKSYLVVISIALLIMSCQDPSPFKDEGRDILEAYGEIKSDTLYAQADTFVVNGKVSTAQGSKLSLGSYQNFESRILVKCDLVPTDTVIMDRLQLLLSSATDFGDGMANLDGMVYRVTDEWEESVNADESWDFRSRIDYSPETSASFSFGPLDSTVYTDFSIELPIKLVEFWQDTVGGNNNHGVLIDFTSSGLIREFSSREGLFVTRLPRIVYSFHLASNDSIISDTLICTKDASLIDFTGSFTSDNLYISSGYTTRAFFEFDFSSIPKSANISSVNFFYERDSLNSIINDNRSHDMYMRNATTNFNSLPSFEIDSTFVLSTRHNIILSEIYSAQLSLDDRIRATTGQFFVQDIINDFVNHGSFMLQYLNEGNDISVYAIKGVSTPERSQRPHLIVEYFLNPAGRL
jgi:hypothetical protein